MIVFDTFFDELFHVTDLYTPKGFLSAMFHQCLFGVFVAEGLEHFIVGHDFTGLVLRNQNNEMKWQSKNDFTAQQVYGSTNILFNPKNG